MTEKKPSASKCYKSILLFFSNKVLDEFKLTYQDLIRENQTDMPQGVLSFRYDYYCYHFRSSLSLLLNDKHPPSAELLKAKFKEIMLYLLKSEPNKMSRLLSDRLHDREVLFRATIENNLYTQLDLEELAFLCNMSLSTFKRHFKLYYATSPRKYFVHKKLEMAEYLLKKGEKPSSVFRKLGYKTLSNFIRAYKAHFGKTPGAVA